LANETKSMVRSRDRGCKRMNVTLGSLWNWTKGPEGGVWDEERGKKPKHRVIDL